MERALALQLIQRGEKLLFVRHENGPDFICRFPYDESFGDACRVIPSWNSVYEPSPIASNPKGIFQGYHVHYLDLPVLEAIAFKNEYRLEYEDRGLLKKLKGEYLDRREWKEKQFVVVPADRPLRAYQNIGAQFMYRACRALNADAMGCISGDAEIIVNRGGNARRYSLRDAYLRFNGLARPSDNWKLPSYTRSMDGDRFSLNRIEGIVSRGHKRVLRIVTESGREIIATPDHVFFVPDGEKAIGSMSVGDELLVNGTELCRVCGKPGKLSERKFKGACRTCVYRRLRHNASTKDGECVDQNGYVAVQKGVRYHPGCRTHGIYKHRLVWEAQVNGLSYDDYMDRLSVGDTSGLLFLEPRQIVHHVDGDKRNNAIKNLSITTASGHARSHSSEATLHLWNVVGPKAERIASIEDVGMTDVYDVVMASPRHSFIVNGFVVHNSGKTAQAIGAVILNKIDGRPHRTLVLCPTSVKGSWLNEVKVVSDLRAMALNSNMDKRFAQYELLDDVDVLVASYDAFLSDYEKIAEHFRPDILILDECHRICNKDNKITQLLIGGRNIKKTFFDYVIPHSIYLLTGTPIGNELEDLYSMLRLMDPGIFSWVGFRARYTLLDEGERWAHPSPEAVAKAEAENADRPKAKKKKFYTVVGYQNEAELKGKLSLHMIRRTKDEILPELPEKQYHTMEIELDKEERKVYEDLRNDWKAAVRSVEVKVENHLAWMIRAQQVCNSLETCAESGAKKSSKMKELLAIVNAEAPNRKIVIFSKFRGMTSIISRELAHWEPLHLHGEVKDEDRQPMIDAFQNDPKHRVFISTIKCGGVGITLTAADLCIFYDKWWSPSANEQAADRLHRIGQVNKVVVLTLRVRDSIEEYIEKCWIEKQLLVDDMIGIEENVREMTLEQREALI